MIPDYKQEKMEEYRVNINQFEGPLDLLLHLVQKAEIDIRDIFVSEITSRYLSYMDQLDEVDMDRASDFLTVAATLLYIKSRQLLPCSDESSGEEEGEEDPEQELIRQLEEYKAFKEAGEDLSRLRETAANAITRLPEDVPLPPPRIDLSSATMDGLYQAFAEMLDRTRHAEQVRKNRSVKADHYTVRRQSERIRKILLKSNRPVRFEELFNGNPKKMEVIVTFMALLEMISRGEIHLSQKEPFSPITLSKKKLLDKDAEVSYMDELPEEI